MKQVNVKIKKNDKFYRVQTKLNKYAKLDMKVERNDEAIFKVFKGYNEAFNTLVISLKFYPAYSNEMKEKFNSAINESYIMDCILNYIITDIGDIYVKRDFSIFKDVKLVKVVIV